MALTPAQRQLLERILGEGRKLGASPMEIKAAVETALVETGIRNLPGGDRDSAGWRQERASLYKDPTNVTNSSRRFFQEARAIKQRGGHKRAGDLAADVQRPAAQYRGRYQDRSGEADKILRELGVGLSSKRGAAGAQMTAGPSTTETTVETPGVDNSPVRRQLMAQYLLQRDRPDALLSLGAGLKQNPDIPGSSETVTTTRPGSPRQPAQPRTRKPTPSKTKGTPGAVRELFYDPVGAWDEGRRISPIGGHSDHVHVSARSHGAAVSLAKTAQRFGLTVRELEPFDKVDPVHTSGSYHYSGRALDVSGTPEQMRAYTNYVRRKYGLR